jgi:ring-1,2-phenylacetyl-CoA epoxidase subunit PaaE
MAPAFHTLHVSGHRRLTPEAFSLTFDVPAALRAAYAFRPGQFLTLRAIVDGVDTRRSYSICAAPGEALRVGVKRVPGGVFSNFLADHVAVGDTLSVMTPDGRFTPPDPTGPRVITAFAAGSGITPILSITRATLNNEPESRVFLFLGNRTAADIMFRDEIEALKDRFLARFSVFHTLSRERQDVPILNGHLDAEKIGALLPSLVPVRLIDHAFICGPLPMIEALPRALTALGLPEDRVHVERFTPSADRPLRAPVPSPDAPTHATATLIQDGARHSFPVGANEALIDAALRAGLDPPFSCKGGMCCTCRARVVEGEVEMVANYSLEPWEIEAGFVLTCQSRPLTKTVTVDFDAV